MIAIVDFGMGNIRSIYYKLGLLGIPAFVSSSTSEIDKADGIILPGVGHFALGIKNLENRGLLSLLNNKAIKEKVPILGICLGMQLMTHFSEEGNCKGLGWVPATTKRFDFTHSPMHYRVPHMGWNELKVCRGSKILLNLDERKRFYFAHSYYISSDDSSLVVATTEYGIEIISVFEKDNIFGVQFHPEKSHEYGMQIFQNFMEICT
jgi:glutamine amidotransferase